MNRDLSSDKSKNQILSPMAVSTVKVRKKKNHLITRTIQSDALKTFERRGWEAVPGEDGSRTAGALAATMQASKKKGVENAGAPEVNKPEATSDGPFADVDDDSTEAGEVSGEPSIDALREEYQILSNKTADKRWSEKRLKDEIAKLQPTQE